MVTNGIGDGARLGLRALMKADIRIWADMHRCTGPDGSVGLFTAAWLAISYAGLRAVLLHRLAHAAHRRQVRLVPLLLANLNMTLHGFDIPPHVPVGPGFYVPHPVGTVIMARALGANLSLVSAVTIGMRKGLDFPLIGDDVYIGAGARVLGGITVGNGAQIGANAVVTRDVPPRSVAVGVPARIRFPADVPAGQMVAALLG